MDDIDQALPKEGQNDASSFGRQDNQIEVSEQQRQGAMNQEQPLIDQHPSAAQQRMLVQFEGGAQDVPGQPGAEPSSLIDEMNPDSAEAQRARMTAAFPMRSSLGEGPTSPLLGRTGGSDQRNHGVDDSFSVQNVRPVPLEEQEDDHLSQRDRLQLSHAFINQQVQASNYSGGPVAMDAAGAPQGAPAQPQGALNRFHWTQAMPLLYTLLLLFMACLSGFFSISGLVFFFLFVFHSFAYYAFRAYDDPIDMLSEKRKHNKSVLLREIFKWAFLAAAIAYLLVQIIGRAAKEYDELKGMLQDTDKETAMKDEYYLDRLLYHIIPDFYSWWNLFRAILVLAAALVLFKIQQEEEQEAQLVSQACLNSYNDIHFSKQLQNVAQPPQAPRADGAVIQNVNAQSEGQSEIVLTLGANENQISSAPNNNTLAIGAPPGAQDNQQNIQTLLTFKPYQVQKCVLIFKDYKMKAELFLVLQITMLVLISNAQYCIYGVPYLCLAAIQLSNICFSHSRTDQNVRVLSGYLTIILLVYLPGDLLAHYYVRKEQDSLKMDDEINQKYGQPRQNYQIEAYHGIMATVPSIVTFVLKIVLLLIECLKYKYSYDMAEVYDNLKNTYRNAKNEEFPQSMRGPAKSGPISEFAASQIQGRTFQSALAKHNDKNEEDQENKKDKDTHREKDGTNLNRFNQQGSKDFQRRQRYNKLLKLQYIKIFRKSQSFVHRILQPISLFMLSLFQMVFVLQHPSVIFIILLALVMIGFFISLDDVAAWRSYTTRGKVIFGIELVYVLVQYILNIYRFDGVSEVQRKEELTIVAGVGSEQQLGYYEDDVSIFDSLFPFNQSVVFLFVIAIFTRYMSKTRIQRRPQSGSRMQEEEDGHFTARKSQGSRSQYSATGQRRGVNGRLTDNSSEVRGPGYAAGPESDDGILTVYDNDTLSVQDFSDVRSQISRRSSNIGGTRRGRAYADHDNQSQNNADLYQFIIQEEEDENDLDEENELDMQTLRNQSDQKSMHSQSENENRAVPRAATFNNSNQNGTLQAPFYLRNMPRLSQTGAQGFELRNRLGQRRPREKRQRPDPTKDSTFRGKTRQWFHKAYLSMLNFFDRVVDISIVHINKLVLLALFLVSVSRPTIINAVLFIMFLVLIMVPLHHEQGYLKLTIFVNSLAICIIYTLDVFIQRDYSAIRTWVLYIIGVQYRTENVQSHVIKLKFLPYVVLQVILVLSIYVYESVKYKQFKSQYMDIETQKQMMIVKQLNKRHQALSESGTRSISRNSGSRVNLRLPPAIGQISVGPAARSQQSDLNRSNTQQQQPMDESRGMEDRDASVNNSSFQREGGEPEEQPPQSEQMNDPANDEGMEKKSLLAENDKEMEMDQEEEDQLMAKDEDKSEHQEGDNNVMGDVHIDDKLTLPDEAKANLRKQQEMIVMYDPLSKFFIKNAAYFLIVFIFIEVVLLPLSIMNILLLILMTIIVVKMLYNETRLQTYRSLSITLQVLNIFVIIYIFTKYLFLFTEYTKNIQLKNSIENGYHQQSTVNDDGSIKHSDRTQEQQKTEDAKNQLHHSHDHDNENQSRQIQNKILQKMFGFQTTEDQKNEGGSLLSFKLLNLAIVLSLTNLLLNILRHRNLAFLLGEKDRVVRREFMQSNNYQAQDGSNMAQDQSSEHSQYMFTLEADEKEEMIAKEKIQMNKKIRSYKQQWACWHYTKIYFGFLLQFLLPITIILLTFIVYPLSTISVPSVIMVLIILILLATNASPDCWRTIYRSIGSLVQIMICVCYTLYFALIDQMSSYDQNDQTERQQFQNMKVLWGVYQSKQVYESQRTGQADDIASVLIAIIPLFIILCTCFLQKELDKWFTHNFEVTIQVTDEIHLEVRKYWRRQRELQKQNTKEDQERVKREFTQGQEESQQVQTVGSQNAKKEDKRKGPLEAISEQANEALSGGTLGAEKSEGNTLEKQTPVLSGASQTSEKDSENEEEKPTAINMEGKLFDVVLESLKATDEETIAYHRGDGKVTKDVTNVFLSQMIENYIEQRQRVEAMQDKNEENDQEELTNKKPNSVATSGLYMSSEQDAMLKESQKQEEIELLNEKKEYLEEFIIDVLEYEAPYRHCFFVKNTAFLEYVAHRNCVNLMIYFGVYSILNKMNLLGLIQWICLYLILKKNFKPNIFKEEENEEDSASYTAEYNRKAKYESSKNEKIVFYVKLQLVLISFLIIVQLAFSIYTNVQFSQQEDFQRNISNSFCAGPSQTYDEEEYDDEGNIYQSASPLVSQNSFNKECAQDWSYYLLSMTAASQSDEESQKNIQENQDFVNTSVVIDIFFLITTYLLLFVAKGTLKLSKQQKLNHPYINDERDFVNYQESKSSQKVSNAIHRFFQSAIFVYFPYFIIVMLMYVSATFNGHAISDLLSSIYLWFALKFIINIKKLFTKNSKILRPLRIYNRIVLTLILVYQMPLFLCPSAVDIQGYTDPDYITTEDCALIMHHQTTNPSKKQYEAKQPMQLYIILMHSIGLLKENQINMTFLFLFFLTEVQQQIFQHPHFREYVVKHMIIEKESDGKVRAFMYVERFHLTRLWANRAIKEEIKILHKILLRLNDQISKSDFAKNLAGFVEYQQKSIKSEADSESHKQLGDDESKALLNNDEDKEQDDKNDEKTEKEIKSSEQSAPDSSKELAAYIELNSHIIDSIALANLRPDKPVIPLKIIVQELKFLLEREIQSGKLERIEKLDEQLLTKYVNQLTKSLESYVYTKNRIDLYHKEGIGLAIALDEREQDPEQQSNLYVDQYKDDGLSKTSKTKSAEQYLKSLSQQTINRQHLFKRLYKSYTDSVNHELQRKEDKRQQSESETKSISTDKAQKAIEEYKSSTELDHQHMQTSLKFKDTPSSEPSSSSSSTSQAKSSIMSSFEQDFNPSPQSYEIGEDSEDEAMQDMTWSQRLNYQIRLFLWNNYVDHLLLIHLRKKDNDTFRLKRPKLHDYGIFRLTEASILSRSTPIVIIFIVFNFIMNANAISLVVVLANLCYQVLENPLVSTKFWKFMMTYMLTVISLKFIYQLPIFCGTPVYTFYSDKCNNEDITSKELASRVDYIIGIHKFAGPASYPKNVGIFYGIFSDILLLMALLLHKQYLSKIGAWNYVNTEDNIYKNPSFKLDERDISNYGLDVRDQHEQLDLLANQHHQIFIYEQSAWYEKGWYAIKKFFYSISNFYGKVLPQYMHRRQKNLDSRKRQWQPYKTHKLQKVKPGQDYFTQIFLVLLIIQIYTLIYWRNISGEDKQQSFAAASVALDRFSTVQVVTLFLILLLLLFERMLYRARYHDERDNYGKYQSQPMVQKKPVAGPESTSNQISSRARARKTAAMRHTLTIKLLVYYSLICLIHGYIGFYVPLYQLAPLSHNPWLVIYYIFWCFYFYYSAKQIKYGYPMAPYKQTFSEDTSFLTFFAWRLYKAIPFIWEMKVIIDWTVTSTCLDLFQWFKLDDAYNTLYYNKEQSDDRKSRPEYQQRASWEKVFKGFCFAIGIIIIILAPIFLFSGINPIMMTNPVKAGLLTIDLELISTGNSYRIFETHASSINPLTKTDDASWRLYFEPQSNQIDYSDMQKLQFNTYSETQWTISPPSLKKFINDFKSISKDKTKETEIVNFKAQWTFTRGQPMGKEKTEGQKIVALSKKDFLPVIEMLERDNQIQLPQLGIVQPVSQKNHMKLAQVDQYSFEDEMDPNQPTYISYDGDDAGAEEQILLQTQDDVNEDFEEDYGQDRDPDQEEDPSQSYTLLAQQSMQNQLLEDQGLSSGQRQRMDPAQLGEREPPGGSYPYQYNPYMYYQPPQQSQQFGDQPDQNTLSPYGPEQQVQQPLYFNAQPPEFAPMSQDFEEQTSSPAPQSYGTFPEPVAIASSATPQPTYASESIASPQSSIPAAPPPPRRSANATLVVGQNDSEPQPKSVAKIAERESGEDRHARKKQQPEDVQSREARPNATKSPVSAPKMSTDQKNQTKHAHATEREQPRPTPAKVEISPKKEVTQKHREVEKTKDSAIHALVAKKEEVHKARMPEQTKTIQKEVATDLRTIQKKLQEAVDKKSENIEKQKHASSGKTSQPVKAPPEQHREPKDEAKQQGRKTADTNVAKPRRSHEPENKPSPTRSSARAQNTTEAGPPATRGNASAAKPQRRIWVEGPAATNATRKDKKDQKDQKDKKEEHQSQPVPKEKPTPIEGNRSAGDDYEYREVEEVNQQRQAGARTSTYRMYRNGKALIAVKDAFPKLLHLNGKADTEDLPVSELQSNTSKYSSMELVLNRQGNQIYYWTFSLGSSDGRGGKNTSAYFRDTPGIFNSRNSQEEIEAENRAERRKQSTSKVDKKLREREKAEMQKKKVYDDQSLVILLYNEQVIGSFFGNALQLSVIGLYATIVITIGRFIRIIFDRISQRVMYEELPNTKQLFEICGGIFIAQQEGDLVREKQLYDLLILMYRSPEALIKITGTRQQHKEEDDATVMDSTESTSKGSSFSETQKKAK